MKIKDITKQRGDVTSLVNLNNDFKSVRIYKYKENMIIKSIDHNDKIQISASTPTGPTSLDTMISIFSDLTTKCIEKFDVKYTNQAIYFYETDIILN